MIRCFVLDDELYAAKIIAGFIKKTPSLSLTGCSTDPFEVIKMVEEKKIDLLFLDIQMPELTGIQLSKIIGKKCQVIFVTAYSDYALDGFELDVVDYLMKPVAYDRFLRSVQKAEQTSLKDPVPEKKVENKHLFVKGDRKNKFHKILMEDVLFIEGLQNYIRIHTKKGTVITYQGLSEVMNLLPPIAFARIHKSYIVAVSQIELIDGNCIFIGQHKLPIGETYRKDFFTFIHQQKP